MSDAVTTGGLEGDVPVLHTYLHYEFFRSATFIGRSLGPRAIADTPAESSQESNVDGQATNTGEEHFKVNFVTLHPRSIYLRVQRPVPMLLHLQHRTSVNTTQTRSPRQLPSSHPKAPDLPLPPHHDVTSGVCTHYTRSTLTSLETRA